MAISVRNSTSLNQTSASTIILNKPTGVVSGDVMYAEIDGDGTAVTSPGWTSLVTTLDTPASDRGTVFRKVAGGAEPSTYTFTGGLIWNGDIVALIGVDNGTPEDVAGAGTTVDTGGGTALVAPSLTTSTDGAWHLVFFNTFNDSSTLSLPTGYTNDVPVFGSGGDVGRADHKLISPAGATGTATSTSNGAGGGHAISLAVRPAAGAAPKEPPPEINLQQAVNRSNTW